MLKSDVKKYYGSFVKAAQALGVIPEKQAYRLENLTRGKLSVDLSLYSKDSDISASATE